MLCRTVKNALQGSLKTKKTAERAHCLYGFCGLFGFMTLECTLYGNSNACINLVCFVGAGLGFSQPLPDW